jgi:phosphoribosylaminoimidazole-succinocarboxamide synthase
VPGTICKVREEKRRKIMEKRNKIYEGKAKILYDTDNPDLVIQEFKDDATAFDATKKGSIKGKGVINNEISCAIFKLLESKGIPTHFVKKLSDREMLVKRLKIIMVEVTIRNISAGGLSKLLGIEEGIVLKMPVLEYHYKNDSLHDPLINDDHIEVLKLATPQEMKKIKDYSFSVNQIMKDFFDKVNLKLVDFKLEFGRHKEKILLGDEVSPDTCRLWDKVTNEKLDKDRFRRDLGRIEEAYQEVLKRIKA